MNRILFSKKALFAMGVAIGMFFMTPAGAHVNANVTHLWNRHFLGMAKQTFFTKTQTRTAFLTKAGARDAFFTKSQSDGRYHRKGQAVAASNFTYSSPLAATAYVDPASCQRDGGGIAPYDQTLVNHSISNEWGPGISTSATSGTIAWYCPVPLDRPPGAQIRLIGSRFVFYDDHPNCLLRAEVYTKPFGGSYGSNVLRATAFSGAGAADLAFGAGDTPITKNFPAFSVPLPATDIAWIRPAVVMTGANGCRFIGAQVNYTVDRP